MIWVDRNAAFCYKHISAPGAVLINIHMCFLMRAMCIPFTRLSSPSRRSFGATGRPWARWPWCGSECVQWRPRAASVIGDGGALKDVECAIASSSSCTLLACGFYIHLTVLSNVKPALHRQCPWMALRPIKAGRTLLHYVNMKLFFHFRSPLGRSI